MHDRVEPIPTRVRKGWPLIIIGSVVVVAGIVARWQLPDANFNMNFFTSFGFVFVGYGIASLVRYGPALRDDEYARRLNAEANDERTILIRLRAGNRAFWLSVCLATVGLFWSSLAANGQLPTLAGDTLWFFLAACVVLPLAVYVGSLLVDEHRM